MKLLLSLLLIVLIVGCSGGVNTTNSNVLDSSGPPVREDVPETIVQGDISDQATNSVVEISMEAKQWDFTPSTVAVRKGDLVRLTVTSIDVDHSISIPAFGVNNHLSPGKTVVVEFLADKIGEFPFICAVYCGSGHGGMRGTLVVSE
jgi:cytochrome c oxidase subunit II